MDRDCYSICLRSVVFDIRWSLEIAIICESLTGLEKSVHSNVSVDVVSGHLSVKKHSVRAALRRRRCHCYGQAAAATAAAAVDGKQVKPASKVCRRCVLFAWLCEAARSSLNADENDRATGGQLVSWRLILLTTPRDWEHSA